MSLKQALYTGSLTIRQGFLQRLVVEGETVAAQYMIKEYSEILEYEAS